MITYKLRNHKYAITREFFSKTLILSKKLNISIRDNMFVSLQFQAAGDIFFIVLTILTQ